MDDITQDDFKTANQGGTPTKATPPPKVVHTPTSMATGREELIMLKHSVEKVYRGISLLIDKVDDAMDLYTRFAFFVTWPDCV